MGIFNKLFMDDELFYPTQKIENKRQVNGVWFNLDLLDNRNRINFFDKIHGNQKNNLKRITKTKTVYP